MADRIFTAKDRYLCSRCTRVIERGEAFTWDRNAKGVYYHLECESPADSNSGIIRTILNAIDAGRRMIITVDFDKD